MKQAHKDLIPALILESGRLLKYPGIPDENTYDLKALDELKQLAELQTVLLCSAEDGPLCREHGFVHAVCSGSSAEALLREHRIYTDRSCVLGEGRGFVGAFAGFGLQPLLLMSDVYGDYKSFGELLFHSVRHALHWLHGHPEGRLSLEQEITRGVNAIRDGGLTVFPTETVYGLGADALQPDAVKKIFAAKKRPFADPLISHVASREQALKLVRELPKQAEKLMDAFWPGPLTLVLPKSDAVPDVVTAGNPTVAVRMPDNFIAHRFIELCGTPVAAPSANSFGKTSPTTAEHVIDQLAGRFDEIIDGGACRVGLESTVLSLTGSTPVLLRPGGVTIEEIEQVIGPIEIQESGHAVTFDSPGMFPSHYAPRTPMIVVDDPSSYAHEPNIAVMLFRPPAEGTVYAGRVYVLSDTGDERSAASQLYETMRRIDREDFRLIVAQRLPHSGLGVAVNDRMGRAAKRD